MKILNSTNIQGALSVSGKITASNGIDGTASYANDSDKLDGKHASEFATSAQGSKADTALQKLTIGTVTTGNAGTNAVATVSTSGTTSTLNLTVPRGNTGAQGEKGEKGDAGTFDSTTEFTELTTSSKNVLGAINEVNSSLETTIHYETSSNSGVVIPDNGGGGSSHEHSNKSVLDGITSSKVSEWDNKSTFDGNYNNLTNKPSIPSTSGLATTTYVNTELGKKANSTHRHNASEIDGFPSGDGGNIFPTVADMKSANLSVGSYATTLGYYSIGDGGGATYIILASSSFSTGSNGKKYKTYVKKSETNNGANNEGYDSGIFYHILNNGNYAEIIIENGVFNILSLGAKSCSVDNITGAYDNYNILNTFMWLDGLFTIDLCGKTFLTGTTIKTYREKTFVNGGIVSNATVFSAHVNYSNKFTFKDLSIISKQNYGIYVTRDSGCDEFYMNRYHNCKIHGYLGGYYSDGSCGFNQHFYGCSFSSDMGNAITGLKGVGTHAIGCDNGNPVGCPNGSLLHNCSDIMWLNSDSNAPMKHAISYDKWCSGQLTIDGNCNFEHIKDKAIYIPDEHMHHISIKNSSFSRIGSGGNTIDYAMEVKRMRNLVLENVTLAGFDSIGHLKVSNLLDNFEKKNTNITKLYVTYNPKTISGDFSGALQDDYMSNPKFLQATKSSNNVIDTNTSMIGFVAPFMKKLNSSGSSVEIMFGDYMCNCIYIDDTTTNTITGVNKSNTNYTTGENGKTGMLPYGTTFTLVNFTSRNITINKGFFLFNADTNYTLKSQSSVSFVYVRKDGYDFFKEI